MRQRFWLGALHPTPETRILGPAPYIRNLNLGTCTLHPKPESWDPRFGTRKMRRHCAFFDGVHLKPISQDLRFREAALENPKRRAWNVQPFVAVSLHSPQTPD